MLALLHESMIITHLSRTFPLAMGVIASSTLFKRRLLNHAFGTLLPGKVNRFLAVEGVAWDDGELDALAECALLENGVRTTDTAGVDFDQNLTKLVGLYRDLGQEPWCAGILENDSVTGLGDDGGHCELAQARRKYVKMGELAIYEVEML
jgi:hypothetical protein